MAECLRRVMKPDLSKVSGAAVLGSCLLAMSRRRIAVCLRTGMETNHRKVIGVPFDTGFEHLTPSWPQVRAWLDGMRRFAEAS
jgi:hypothetical protein